MHSVVRIVIVSVDKMKCKGLPLMYSPRTVVQFVGRKLCCIVDTAGSEEQEISGED